MQDDLDKLIDGALAEYSSAEPLSGLEDRVMQRVRGAKTTRRRRWLWALAIPALAAILIAILIQRPVPPPPVAKITPPPPPVQVVTPPAPPAVQVAITRRRAPNPKPAERRELPKKEYFPTLSPLTSQERMMVALAESHPAELLKQPVDRIEIKPIQIAPLQIDGGQ